METQLVTARGNGDLGNERVISHVVFVLQKSKIIACENVAYLVG